MENEKEPLPPDELQEIEEAYQVVQGLEDPGKKAKALSILQGHVKDLSESFEEPAPGFWKSALDYGLRAVDYTSGYVRTGASVIPAAIAEAVTGKDVMNMGDIGDTILGKAPSTETYADRAGVPEGPTLETPFGNISAKDAATFGLDMAFSPGGAAGVSSVARKLMRGAPKGLPAIERGAALAEKKALKMGGGASLKEKLLAKLRGVGASLARGTGAGDVIEKAGTSLAKSPFNSADAIAEHLGNTPPGETLVEAGFVGTSAAANRKRKALIEQLGAKNRVAIRHAAEDGASLKIPKEDLMSPEVMAVLEKDRKAPYPALLGISLVNDVKQRAQNIISGSKGWGVKGAVPSANKIPDQVVELGHTMADYKATGRKARQTVENMADAVESGVGGDIWERNQRLGGLKETKVANEFRTKAKGGSASALQNPWVLGGGLSGALSAFGQEERDPQKILLATLIGAGAGSTAGRTAIGQTLRKAAPVTGQALRAGTIDFKRQPNIWKSLLADPEEEQK